MKNITHHVPRVTRLDKDLLFVLNSEPFSDLDEAALRLARSMAGYSFVYEMLGVTDLFEFSKRLIKDSEYFEQSVRRFECHDLTQDIKDVYSRCSRFLGMERPLAPSYFVAFGERDKTNARYFGVSPKTGRPRVALNLAAIETSREWEIAILHESVHTFQDRAAQDLLSLCMLEGVAIWVTQQIEKSVTDYEALMWSRDQLDAARIRVDAIIEEFDRVKHSRERSDLVRFVAANVSLSEVPGAPSRTGYYLGWLAIRTWFEQSGARHPSEALNATAEEIWQALRSV